MRRKAFGLNIQLIIKEISCPGVWLCPKGNLTLVISALGSCLESSFYKPAFPVVTNERIVLQKNFYTAFTLRDLQNMIEDELIIIELVQWPHHGCKEVLAIFQAPISELLYPTPYDKSILPGLDLELLMEADKNFPGIIAPKINVSTIATIKEIVCSHEKDLHVISPKMIVSQAVAPRSPLIHQKTVCHCKTTKRKCRCRKRKGTAAKKAQRQNKPIRLGKTLCSRPFSYPCCPNCEDCSEWNKMKFCCDHSLSGHAIGMCPICDKYYRVFNVPRNMDCCSQSSAKESCASCVNQFLRESSPSKMSLAEQIHDRLNKTLSLNEN